MRQQRPADRIPHPRQRGTDAAKDDTARCCSLKGVALWRLLSRSPCHRRHSLTQHPNPTWPISMSAVFLRLAQGVYTMGTLLSLQPKMANPGNDAGVVRAGARRAAQTQVRAKQEGERLERS
jgi:hypothetical protein